MSEFLEKRFSIPRKSMNCPACNAEVTDVRYVYYENNKQSNFFRCSRCTFIFARPLPIPAIDERQLDDIDYAELFNSPLLKNLYTNFFIKREIRILKKYRRGKNLKLIDIGCGTGWTTSIFGKNGFEVTGLEPSKTRSKFARDTYGIRTLTGHIENVNIQETFGTVVLRHIIEHVEDPKSVIEKIGELLENQGLLLLVCPNINSLGRYLFGAQWSSWGLPWHCNFFTPKSIKALLDHSDFEILKSYQTPSPLHFTQSLLSKYANNTLSRFLETNKILSIVLSAPFALLGTALGLGDTLNIVARKK